MSQIKQMFELQKQLNDNTNGSEWINGITREGRLISWYRCIYMEACEAIDSFNWKHWKNINAEPDWANARVELVDIWHFIMSEAIRLGDAHYAEKFQNNEVASKVDGDILVKLLERMLCICAQANIDQSKNPIREVTDIFFKAIAHIDMDVPDLYQRYVVKNQLNSFRQKHGYKEGAYLKIWRGLEDNVIALRIMQEHPNLTPEQLYKELEKEYSLVG